MKNEIDLWIIQRLSDLNLMRKTTMAGFKRKLYLERKQWMMVLVAVQMERAVA
jgi:hypothetical protein